MTLAARAVVELFPPCQAPGRAPPRARGVLYRGITFDVTELDGKKSGQRIVLQDGSELFLREPTRGQPVGKMQPLKAQLYRTLFSFQM